MTMTPTNAGAQLSADDKLAIHELLAQFCHASDYGDHEGLREVLTDDCVTELDGQTIRFAGVEANIAHSRKSEEVSGGKNRHYYFNIIAESDGDGARARHCFLNVYAGEAVMKGRIVTSGRTHDRLVRTPQGWRIAHRRVTFDQSVAIEW